MAGKIGAGESVGRGVGAADKAVGSGVGAVSGKAVGSAVAAASGSGVDSKTGCDIVPTVDPGVEAGNVTAVETDSLVPVSGARLLSPVE